MTNCQRLQKGLRPQEKIRQSYQDEHARCDSGWEDEQCERRAITVCVCLRINYFSSYDKVVCI